jgi:hypothetical protein
MPVHYFRVRNSILLVTLPKFKKTDLDSVELINLGKPLIKRQIILLLKLLPLAYVLLIKRNNLGAVCLFKRFLKTRN